MLHLMHMCHVHMHIVDASRARMIIYFSPFQIQHIYPFRILHILHVCTMLMLE